MCLHVIKGNHMDQKLQGIFERKCAHYVREVMTRSNVLHVRIIRENYHFAVECDKMVKIRQVSNVFK